MTAHDCPFDAGGTACPVCANEHADEVRRLGLIERLRLRVAQDDAVLTAVVILHLHQQEKKR